jgi:hypothetical protein
MFKANRELDYIPFQGESMVIENGLDVQTHNILQYILVQESVN